ncbi:MAG: FtsX-like permease family protein, partial [Candidatus Bathyarchaeota archaeon]
MSEISFPIKDLTRRRLQTSLTILGLTICTSATVFLVVFGGNLGFEITFLAIKGRLTSGFSNIFSSFIFVVGLLNILAGAFATSFLVYLTMSERVRDIGVMKATGCLSGSILGYYVTELSILVFLSCTAGTILGVGINYISMNLLKAFGFSISPSPSLWVVLLVFLVLVLVSHIFGVLPIIKAAKVKPAEALSPLHSLGTTFKSGRTFPSKLGFAFRIAYRSLVRRKLATGQAIICLSVVLTLTTVTIAGGLIAKQTTTNYVERAIGKDVVLVAHPNVAEHYVDLLSKFFEAKEIEQIDYLDLDLFFSESLVFELSNVSGVRKVDPRLVLEASVLEIPGIIPNPNDPNEAIIIGDSRSDEALILGINPDVVVNDWLIMGRIFGKTDQGCAIIGDALALNMFTDPQNQSIRIFVDNLEILEIVGVCLDPLNNGKVVYMPINALVGTFGRLGYNLLFLEIDPLKRSEALSKIETKTSSEELVVVELNEVYGRHANFLNQTWSLIMFLPLFSLATATLCLLSYLMLSISGQQREFGIMRALGTKPGSIMKIVLSQALLVTSVGGAIGISIGLFATFALFIPEPVAS